MWVDKYGLFSGRERSELRTLAGPGDGHIPTTLNMARGQADQPAARIVQIQCGLMASLDVKKNFDVAKPSAVSKILTLLVSTDT